jgi:hypothetical protein
MITFENISIKLVNLIMPRFAIYTSLTWFFLPFVAIVILYCGIVVKVRKSNQKKIASLHQTEATGTTQEQDTLTSGDTSEGLQNKT